MSQPKPATFGPYSPVRQAGDWYYISGQVGADPATKTAPPGITGQTQAAFHNLEQLLTAHGLTLENVIKTTIFLADMDDFAAMNDVFNATFTTQPKPARSTVAVRELPRVADHPILVEVEAIAFHD